MNSKYFLLNIDKFKCLRFEQISTLGNFYFMETNVYI